MIRPGLSLLVALCVTSSPLAASIFYRDDQVPMSRAHGSDYSPFGVVLDMVSLQTGSGTLIGACHVLTVRHFIPTNDQAESRREGWSFRFGAGPARDGRHVERLVQATPVAWGDFDKSKNSFENAANDWMLLRLKDCVGTPELYGHVAVEAVGYAQLAALTDSFTKVGHPGNKPMEAGAWVQLRCRITGQLRNGYDPKEKRSFRSPERLWDDVWATDCPTLKGDSGGAILYRGADNRFRLTCMLITGEYDPTPKPYKDALVNICLSSNAFWGKIQPVLHDAGDD
nr:trypsin-like peptidase domain-containing protein [Sphingomonas quercus]